MTRTIIIGDVHGCVKEVEDLLHTVSYTSADALVFVGDLLDRGPDPVGAVRLARRLGAVCVRGNHERKYLRYREREKRVAAGALEKNPMRPFAGEALEAYLALDVDDWNYLEATPLVHRISSRWVVTHAGMAPGVPVDAQREEHLTMLRYWNTKGNKSLALGQELAHPDTAAFWSTVWTGPESVVYGHHVSRGQIAMDHPAPGITCLGIDTGCVYGHTLTAVVFVDGEFTAAASVQARERYSTRSEEE